MLYSSIRAGSFKGKMSSLEEKIMKTWKTILLILVAVGLPVIGIAAILTLRYLWSSDHRDHIVESPPKDYPE